LDKFYKDNPWADNAHLELIIKQTGLNESIIRNYIEQRRMNIYHTDTNEIFSSSYPTSGKMNLFQQIICSFLFCFEDYYPTYPYPTDWRYKF